MGDTMGGNCVIEWLQFRIWVLRHNDMLLRNYDMVLCDPTFALEL